MCNSARPHTFPDIASVRSNLHHYTLQQLNQYFQHRQELFALYMPAHHTFFTLPYFAKLNSAPKCMQQLDYIMLACSVNSSINWQGTFKTPKIRHFSTRLLKMGGKCSDIFLATTQLHFTCSPKICQEEFQNLNVSVSCFRAFSNMYSCSATNICATFMTQQNRFLAGTTDVKARINHSV